MQQFVRHVGNRFGDLEVEEVHFFVFHIQKRFIVDGVDHRPRVFQIDPVPHSVAPAGPPRVQQVGVALRRKGRKRMRGNILGSFLLLRESLPR